MQPEHTGPDDRSRFEHMLEAARDAVRFATGRSRADLDSDAMFRRAALNAIGEVGEAAARTTDAGRSRAPDVPWGQIVQMRNILVHVYWGVDLDRVWNPLTMDLPPFLAQLQAALAAWPAEGERAPHVQ
jgi:uncharacterized protein with HEPN domain